MYKKTINLSPENRNALCFCVINRQNVLIYKNQKKLPEFYIPIPYFISISTSLYTFTFTGPLSKNKEINVFISLFRKFIKLSNKQFAKILILRGLGFRINTSLNSLQFKIGFSHLINIALSSCKVTALVKKKTLYLVGPNPIFLGNFAEKIKQFKKPNCYTGKGFEFKNQNLFIKIFKKK